MTKRRKMLMHDTGLPGSPNTGLPSHIARMVGMRAGQHPARTAALRVVAIRIAERALAVEPIGARNGDIVRLTGWSAVASTCWPRASHWSTMSSSTRTSSAALVGPGWRAGGRCDATASLLIESVKVLVPAAEAAPTPPGASREARPAVCGKWFFTEP